MLRYYVEIAPFILPHLAQRPVTLIRFPEGVKGVSFYEKNAPGHAPGWLQTFPVPRHRGGFINYILVNDAETLAWCANLGAIEFHPFLHRVPAIDRPTHVAFDLDPGEGADIFTCIEVGFRLKALFEGLGLESFPKVSGSKGLQIYVPLNTGAPYAGVQPFAKSVAELLERQHPDLIVSAMSKALRKKKVLIDWSQNSPSKTTVAAYAMRAKHDEPFISMPLGWDELAEARRRRRRSALYFTPEEALRRAERLGDIFAPVLELKQQLPQEFLELGEASPTGSRRAGTVRTGAGSGRRVAAGESKSRPVRRGAGAALARYKAKRDFSRTHEPAGDGTMVPAGPAAAPRFVVQKHAASRLHYDFRLEMDGTLKSWAVPKGPPFELGVKRGAFEVEDHPLDYLEFEGTIPQGQYGGGTVMVWDIGTYELLGGSHAKGDLKLALHGRKMKGEWHIFRIKSDPAKPVWLLAKSRTPARPPTERQDDRSVLTRRSMARIAADNTAQWTSDRADAPAKPGQRSRKTPPRKSTGKGGARKPGSRRTGARRASKQAGAARRRSAARGKGRSAANRRGTASRVR